MNNILKVVIVLLELQTCHIIVDFFTKLAIITNLEKSDYKQQISVDILTKLDFKWLLLNNILIKFHRQNKPISPLEDKYKLNHTYIC